MKVNGSSLVESAAAKEETADEDEDDDAAESLPVSRTCFSFAKVTGVLRRVHTSMHRSTPVGGEREEGRASERGEVITAQRPLLSAEADRGKKKKTSENFESSRML